MKKRGMFIIVIGVIALLLINDKKVNVEKLNVKTNTETINEVKEVKQVKLQVVKDVQKNDTEKKTVAPFSNSELFIKHKQLEKEFDLAIDRLNKAIKQINEYGLTGNAPDYIVREYKKAKDYAIKMHTSYLKSVKENLEYIYNKGSNS